MLVESDVIRARTREGMQVAKAKGGGRPPSTAMPRKLLAQLTQSRAGRRPYIRTGHDS